MFKTSAGKIETEMLKLETETIKVLGEKIIYNNSHCTDHPYDWQGKRRATIFIKYETLDIEFLVI